MLGLKGAVHTLGGDDVTVSIIMPLYNALPFFLGSIYSVLNQKYPHWELIIVDDCSTDGSGEQALLFSKSDSRIKYFKNEINSGVALSRNVGLDKATGRFVAFLDSDDQWEADKLERQVFFALNNSAIITYCSYVRVSESGAVLGEVKPNTSISYKDMLYRNQIGNLTAMYDRTVLGELRFKSVGHEDYLFWVEAVRKAGSAELVPSEMPLARYLVRKSSLSGNKFKAAKWQWNNYRNNIGLGFVGSLFYFSCYVVSAVLRRL